MLYWLMIIAHAAPKYRHLPLRVVCEIGYHRVLFLHARPPYAECVPDAVASFFRR